MDANFSWDRVPRLAAVLSHYPADCQPLSLERIAGTAAGLSGAAVWRMETPRGPLCLRCWPEEGPSPERLAWIQSVILQAQAQGFSLLPAPVATRRGQGSLTLDGQLWSIENWMPGEADLRVSPSRARLTAAMAALAHYHLATADFATDRSAAADLIFVSSISLERGSYLRQSDSGPSPNVLHRLAMLQHVVQTAEPLLKRWHASGQLTQWREPVRIWLELLPSLAVFVGRRLEAASGQSARLQPCLRDIWREHVLFQQDEVTGMVDLAAMHRDLPATDIARLLASYAGDDEQLWAEGLDGYSQHRSLEPAEQDLIATLDMSSMLLTPWNWFRWLLLEGRTFERNPGELLQRVWVALDRLENLQRRGGRWILE